MDALDQLVVDDAQGDPPPYDPARYPPPPPNGAAAHGAAGNGVAAQVVQAGGLWRRMERRARNNPLRLSLFIAFLASCGVVGGWALNHYFPPKDGSKQPANSTVPTLPPSTSPTPSGSTLLDSFTSSTTPVTMPTSAPLINCTGGSCVINVNSPVGDLINKRSLDYQTFASFFRDADVGDAAGLVDYMIETGDFSHVEKLYAYIMYHETAVFARAGLLDNIAKVLLAAITNDDDAGTRETAIQLVEYLVENGLGNAVEPFFYEKLMKTIVSETFADKEKTVREAAVSAVRSVVQVSTSWAVPIFLPILLEQIKTADKWQVKTGALQVMDQLVVSAPKQCARLMPEIIPVMVDAIWDTKSDVKKAARASLTTLCALVTNKDIEKFVPALINCLINPVEETTKTVQLLAATTFVQEVDSPTLALMAPLLARGLTEKLTATVRKVAVIIDNMTKLVDNENTIRPFVPELLPGLIKVEKTVGDPEARGVVVKAIKTLRDIANCTGDGSELPPPRVVTNKDTAGPVVESIKTVDSASKLDASSPLVDYIAELVGNLCTAREFEPTEWESCLTPYVALALPESIRANKAINVARDLLEKLVKDEEETTVIG